MDERDGDTDAGSEEAMDKILPPEALDAFGTLSISEHGISRFFGPTGGSEVRLGAAFQLAYFADFVLRVCFWPIETRTMRHQRVSQPPITSMGPVPHPA